MVKIGDKVTVLVNNQTVAYNRYGSLLPIIRGMELTGHIVYLRSDGKIGAVEFPIAVYPMTELEEKKGHHNAWGRGKDLRCTCIYLDHEQVYVHSTPTLSEIERLMLGSMIHYDIETDLLEGRAGRGYVFSKPRRIGHTAAQKMVDDYIKMLAPPPPIIMDFSDFMKSDLSIAMGMAMMAACNEEFGPYGSEEVLLCLL